MAVYYIWYIKSLLYQPYKLHQLIKPSWIQAVSLNAAHNTVRRWMWNDELISSQQVNKRCSLEADDISGKVETIISIVKRYHSFVQPQCKGHWSFDGSLLLRALTFKRANGSLGPSTTTTTRSPPLIISLHTFIPGQVMFNSIHLFALSPIVFCQFLANVLKFWMVKRHGILEIVMVITFPLSGCFIILRS